jgi:hypothetical protein
MVVNRRLLVVLLGCATFACAATSPTSPPSFECQQLYPHFLRAFSANFSLPANPTAEQKYDADIQNYVVNHEFVLDCCLFTAVMRSDGGPAFPVEDRFQVCLGGDGRVLRYSPY